MATDTMMALEKELTSFANGGDWREVLGEACLLDSPLVGAEEIFPWEPGGAETYIHHVRLLTARGSKRVLFKAFVPFPGTISVGEAVDRTVRRTDALMSAGLPVPAIYAIADGTILTDYIDESIGDALRRRPHETAVAAAGYLRAISMLGCDVSLCVHDLRFSSNVAYLVDLGSDFREVSAEALSETTRRTMDAFGRLLQNTSLFTGEEIQYFAKGDVAE